MKAKAIIEHIESLAPREAVLPGDRVGLQIGDPEREIKIVLIALTPTAAVADEAARRGADMLLTHHPILFEPVDSISPATETGRILLALGRTGIVAYSAHTNLDGAPEGVTAALCRKLGFEETEPLFHYFTPEVKKLVTFVPAEHLERVAKAMGDAGAGIIGDYSHCSFRMNGTGAYIPMEGADPYAGKIGKLERAAEARIEVLVSKKTLPRVLDAMFEAHPYEEVAYDVYPLENADRRFAMGAAATLPEPLSFRGLLGEVKKKLGLAAIRYAGDAERIVRRVAVCGGAGSNLLPAVIAKGCEAFITGDVKYHFALEAVQKGIAVADIGHHESELPVVEHLLKLLETRFPEIRFLACETETNPFKYL